MKLYTAYIAIVLVFSLTLVNIEASQTYPVKKSKQPKSPRQQQQKMSSKNENRELKRVHRQLRADLLAEIGKVKDREKARQMIQGVEEIEDEAEQNLRSLSSPDELSHLESENEIFRNLNHDLLFAMKQLLELEQVETGRVPAREAQYVEVNS